MVAYSFKQQFIEPIRAGLKRQTVRPHRKRHARPGEELQLYSGMRTPSCFLIGRALCVRVREITLEVYGNSLNIFIEGKLLPGEKKTNEFARADGFADWKAMRDFWRNQYRREMDSAVAWQGMLIEWGSGIMTDLSNWRDCIHILKTWSKDPAEEGAYLYERLMVPLNEYQMGNLIDAIAQVRETGDWYREFCAIVAAAMRYKGFKQLTSNNGRVFTRDQIERGEISLAEGASD